MRKAAIALIFSVVFLSACQQAARQPDTMALSTAVAATVVALPTATLYPTYTRAPSSTPSPPTATAQAATYTPSPSPTSTSLPIPTTTFTPTPSTVAQRDANLRAGPGTNYPVAGGVKAGQVLDIVAKSAANDWYQLADAKWIAAKLVQGAPSVKVAAVIPTPPLPTPTAAAWDISGPIKRAMPQCGVQFGYFPEWTDQGNNTFAVQDDNSKGFVIVKCVAMGNQMKTRDDAQVMGNTFASTLGLGSMYVSEFGSHVGTEFPLTYASYQGYSTTGQPVQVYISLVEVADGKCLSVFAVEAPAMDMRLVSELVGLTTGVTSLHGG